MAERITVWITTVDHANRSRTFKTAKGALAYITKWVGNPEGAECNRVVSFDGVVVADCSHDILALVKSAAPEPEPFPTKRDVAAADELAAKLNAEPPARDCCTDEELEKVLVTARDVLEGWRIEAEYEREMAKRVTRYD